MKKFAGDIIILHKCTKNHNIVPEIWSATDRIFVILDCFFPFYPSMDPENQNFEKMKKTLEDIIILQMFTINNTHMIHGFSDMECIRQMFCHFGLFFALLPP